VNNYEAPRQAKPFLNPIESFMAQLPDRRSKRKYIEAYQKQCLDWPEYMKADPMPDDILAEGKVLGAWRSCKFAAIAWKSEHPQILCRLVINKVEIDLNGSWVGGIGWDDLWDIKNQCGYDQHDAVEIYPSKDKLEYVANMRHLWVFRSPLGFGLRTAAV
jgi:hypothetical protein